MKLTIPNSDEIGLKIIKKTIPHLSENKLYQLINKVNEYPESDEKKQILEYIRNEFKKRCLPIDF
jgi:ribosome-associated toxin RatA of RatAB toxin-antitoxin module